MPDLHLLPSGLTALGFEPDEVFASQALPDGRVLVPARIDGHEALLAPSTNLREELKLHLGYARRQGLKLGGAYVPGVLGAFQVTELSALGRSRAPDGLVLAIGRESSNSGELAGSLGLGFFADRILGIDSAGPSAALSGRAEVRSGFARAVYRIPLLPGTLNRRPVTRALSDVNAPSAAPALLMNPMLLRSSVSLTYALERWTDRRLQRHVRRAAAGRGTVPLRLLLPDGCEVHLEAVVEEKTPEFTEAGPADRVDGILGIDFLRRWMQVFDFPGGELALFDY